MPRELVLGNGNILVNLDHALNMRDFYYPYVGMLNHISGHKNRVGVWVGQEFSWLESAEWEKTNAYETDTLISDIMVKNAKLGLDLRFNDAVHFRENLFIRTVRVTNHANQAREVRLFFTQDFSIDQTDIGDTAVYDLEQDAVLHYKRDTCFLISGEVEGQGGIYQYATGTKRFGGAEGTWRDAEDGWLEGNPIAQGSVDSTVSFSVQLKPRETVRVHYWIAAADGFEEVRRLQDRVRDRGADRLLNETRAYWRSWLGKHDWNFRGLSGSVTDLFKRSLLIVRTQIDNGGAILAANDTDILQFNRDHYSYMWPRDGAFVAYALDRAGYPELTRAFYLFCRDAISPEGFFWHKYHPDGSVGSSWHPWVKDGKPQLPIQEDETALVLHSLWTHYELVRDLEFVESIYHSLIQPAAIFLDEYRDKVTKLPLDSHDLWEERRGIFTYTVASVWAGLRAAANFARLFGEDDYAKRFEIGATEVKDALEKYLYDPRLGRFMRGLYPQADGSFLKDTTLESSLAALFILGVYPPNDPKIVSTMAAIKEGLWVKTPVGGVARYSRDYYFQKRTDFDNVPGNPWIICTLWLAMYHIACADTVEEMEPAVQLLEWAAAKTMESGVLPEQLHPDTGEPLSVAPLTWSHATFVHTVIEYMEKHRKIKERRHLAEAWHASPL